MPQPLPMNRVHPLAPASGVYEIVNQRNGKRYIGSAQRFGPRWAQHLRRLRKGNHHSWKLQKDFNGFGEAAFRFTPLLVCKLKDLSLFESRALTAFNAVDDGYNVSRDVEAPMRGRKHPAETREKMRGPRAPFSEATKQRMRDAAVLRPPVSEATKEKIRMAQVGRPVASEETRRKITQAGIGRAVSEKSRQAIIARNIARTGQPGQPGQPGHPLTEEHRQKLIAASKARKGMPGMKLTEEQRAVRKAKLQVARDERAAAGMKPGDGAGPGKRVRTKYRPLTSNHSSEGATVPPLPVGD